MLVLGTMDDGVWISVYIYGGVLWALLRSNRNGED